MCFNCITGNAYAWSSSTNPFDSEDDLATNVSTVRVNVTTLNESIEITDTNDVLKLWTFNDTIDVLRAGSRLFSPHRTVGRVTALWFAVFRDYHGDALFHQVEEIFDLCRNNGLKHFTSPLTIGIDVSSPGDVVEISKNHQIFPIIASRTPTLIEGRDLFIPADSHQQIFEPTATLSDEVCLHIFLHIASKHITRFHCS